MNIDTSRLQAKDASILHNKETDHLSYHQDCSLFNNSGLVFKTVSTRPHKAAGVLANAGYAAIPSFAGLCCAKN